MLSISTSKLAVPVPAPTELTWPPDTFDALAWHVGITNPSIITSLRDTLPVATVLYHIDLYKAHVSAQAANKTLVPLPKAACTKLRWPQVRSDTFRLRVCNLFHAFKGGGDGNTRLPRNTVLKFVEAHIDCNRLPKPAIAIIPRTIRQWYKRWHEHPDGRGLH